MKNLTDLIVTQLRLYRADSYSSAHLCTPEMVANLKDLFSFEQAQSDGSSVVLTNGTYKHEQKLIPIHNITIEPRRMIHKIMGESAIADDIYDLLVGKLGSLGLGSRETNYSPLIKTEETSCIATLEVEFFQLFSDTFASFLKTDGNTYFKTDYGLPRAFGLKELSFEIRYLIADEELGDHSISLGNKLFRLEPRAGVPWKEQRYFTSSPLDSSSHLYLLQRFEEVFSS